ncbi:MAG: hypothetical protein ACLGGX_11805 [Bdellovibrionia bacterium]
MKIKTVFLALSILLSINSHAKTILEDHQSLRSHELKEIGNGFLDAHVIATDSYITAYHLPALNRVKNIEKYLQSILGSEDTVTIKDPKNSADLHQLAYDISFELMHGDPYNQNSVDLKHIGSLIMPIFNALKDPSIIVMSAYGSDDQFSARHVYFIAISKTTKEMIILTVGYSE